ncbi:phosphonate metabolism transcriptional regulator PhnF [Paracidovorax anthurii]|uniref:GntR family phosphonate transport system transcriptional regulator n=1 Tax=Paracidovorax anthurii TaxID=78229 RepID=A0A328ZJT4_9BURK|nr:phosphonate metabolism transcriptional regulator PhnF [Paracidovorax anthurii]RAR85483.1 GntR family phosphonate transport system transcriptional regulator [Paracidovorax anthurii]
MTFQATSGSPAEGQGGERDRFWASIANDIADAIARGVYAPGSRLPSEHALAEQFGVNRHTIRRSLSSLAQRGLVRATQGSGTYVEDFAVDLALGRRTRYRENLAQVGLRGRLRVLSGERLRATADLARVLQVPARSPLLHLHVLGEGEGQPLHVSSRYFPLPRFARLEDIVRATGSITEAFAAHGVPDYQRPESRITARMPTPDVAAVLRQPPARPVLQVKSVNVDAQGVPIEYACTWFAGDRVSLTVDHFHG